MRFHLNYLKVLEPYDQVQRTGKGDFLTQNTLGMSQSFALESGQNAEICYTNHLLPKRFQGTF